MIKIKAYLNTRIICEQVVKSPKVVYIPEDEKNKPENEQSKYMSFMAWINAVPTKAGEDVSIVISKDRDDTSETVNVGRGATSDVASKKEEADKVAANKIRGIKTERTFKNSDIFFTVNLKKLKEYAAAKSINIMTCEKLEIEFEINSEVNNYDYDVTVIIPTTKPGEVITYLGNGRTPEAREIHRQKKIQTAVQQAAAPKNVVVNTEPLAEDEIPKNDNDDLPF